MNYDTIIYKKENNVALIVLNRPESLNAISSKLAQELEQVLEAVTIDEEVRVAIVTGEGKAFCAGADIKEMMSSEEASIAGRLSKGKPLPIFDKIENLEKPIIAAVNGVATGGGCELALACDLRIASTLAAFGLGEIKIGVIPGGGGTVRLPRLIGAGKAKEMLFFGEVISVEEAYRTGLVNKVVSPELLLKEAQQWAQLLSQRPPLALKAAKSCVNLGMRMDLGVALAYEAAEISSLMGSKDQIEGMTAFLEKRKPVFEGK
ncbi:MAG: enoyl-CoA hydratase/isomerase family protein [Chloroflexota bacterium]|nr:enoyl-CoA hydratase/isomerase family protein [Chloroflexota bacterium]